MTAMVMPEWPRASALTFSARISRTTGSGSASPTPAACESNRLRCSSSSCSVGMRVWASRPKPVLMPYAASPLAMIVIDQGARRRDAAAIVRAPSAERYRLLVDPPQRRQRQLAGANVQSSGHSVSSLDHRQVQTLLAGAGDGDLIAGVGMAHDAGARIVPQHAANALGRGRRCRRRR